MWLDASGDDGEGGGLLRLGGGTSGLLRLLRVLLLLRQRLLWLVRARLLLLL